MADLDGDYWFVLLLSRDDLEACGFDLSKVDDETMGKLADAMEEPTAASSMTCGNAPTAWAFQSAAGSIPAARSNYQLSSSINRMGIDIYAKWDGMTEAGENEQYRTPLCAEHGHVGFGSIRRPGHLRSIPRVSGD